MVEQDGGFMGDGPAVGGGEGIEDNVRGEDGGEDAEERDQWVDTGEEDAVEVGNWGWGGHFGIDVVEFGVDVGRRRCCSLRGNLNVSIRLGSLNSTLSALV